MKNLILILMSFGLFFCKSETKQARVLTDSEWRDILDCTFPLAKGNVPYIYKEYENTESKDIISRVYINCTDLGYKINDSILSYINNRINKPITNKLDTMFNVKFVSNVKSFNNNYIAYSEPFYVNNEVLCISMGNWVVKESETLQWIIFFKKQNGHFQIIKLYDVKNDKFYKRAKL